MSPRRAWAVARKEFLHIVRDLRSLSMALALPLFMILLFGYALSLDVDRIPTVLYDADRTPQSRDLLAQFRGSRYFQIEAVAEDYATVERKLDKGECLLGVVVPQDYSVRLLSRREPRVQLLLDGSDSNTASIALGYAEGIAQSYGNRLRLESLNRGAGNLPAVPVEARIRVWYNSELKSRNYIVPGLIAVVLTIVGALLTSLTVAREWEMGTMEQLLSTPLRASELVLGKMAAFFALGVADTLLALVVGVLIFRVPLRGSLLVLAVTSCIFLVGAFFWGILLSSVARSQLLAYQMSMISSFLPAFLLSGFIYAIETMPPVIRAISYVTPSRYFVTVLKGVFLKGVGIRVLWTEVAFLMVYAVIVFFAATRKVKTKLA